MHASPEPNRHLFPAARTSASRESAASYVNCTALTKVYKNGVAKAGVKYNKVSGVNRAFKYKPYYSTAIYTANVKLDGDKDGIACERG